MFNVFVCVLFVLSVMIVFLPSSCFFGSSTSLPSVFFIVFFSFFPCRFLSLTTCHETSLQSDSSEDDLASSLPLPIFSSETFLSSTVFNFFPIFVEDKKVADLFLSNLQLFQVFRSFLRSMRFSFPTSGLQELHDRPYLLHRGHLGRRHFVRI